MTKKKAPTNGQREATKKATKKSGKAKGRAAGDTPDGNLGDLSPPTENDPRQGSLPGVSTNEPPAKKSRLQVQIERQRKRLADLEKREQEAKRKAEERAARGPSAREINGIARQCRTLVKAWHILNGAEAEDENRVDDRGKAVWYLGVTVETLCGQWIEKAAAWRAAGGGGKLQPLGVGMDWRTTGVATGKGDNDG